LSRTSIPDPQTPSPLRGILPIVYTPFDAEGAVDLEDLERLVDYLIEAGAHGLAADHRELSAVMERMGPPY